MAVAGSGHISRFVHLLLLVGGLLSSCNRSRFLHFGLCCVLAVDRSGSSRSAEVREVGEVYDDLLHFVPFLTHWPLVMRFLTETSILHGGCGPKQLKVPLRLPASWLVAPLPPRTGGERVCSVS